MSNVFDFISRRIDTLRELGRVRGAEALASTLRSFSAFCYGRRLAFSDFTCSLMLGYEAWLRASGVSRNTSSFYMRNLRAAYNEAVDAGITPDLRPFAKVYTGIDKTAKRALSRDMLRRIIGVELSARPHLQWARDMFLFSFYARGMPFVDMAYLRKSDICGGIITYRRRKTGQQLSVEITVEMQTIIDRYAGAGPYLLPLITHADGTERRRYLSALKRLNRHLKTVGALAGVSTPLSSYCSRHSWATIARDMGIPLVIISQGLGHDNPRTTQIYLDSLQTSVIHAANKQIIASLVGRV